MSGGPYINGWINGFFPYLVDCESGLATIRHHFFVGNDLAGEEIRIPAWFDRLKRKFSYSRKVELNNRLRVTGNTRRGRLHTLDPLRGFDGERGATTHSFPSGLSTAPFLWRYLNQQIQMEFLGGFVGVHQQSGSMRLRPEIGWAVRAMAATS